MKARDEEARSKIPPFTWLVKEIEQGGIEAKAVKALLDIGLYTLPEMAIILEAVVYKLHKDTSIKRNKLWNREIHSLNRERKKRRNGSLVEG
ncbi:MAG: hypothetical protein M1339_02285 [Bacteroidetes bacterium]|nr:hypothetical protein [Bacteroidota bacterium]